MGPHGPLKPPGVWHLAVRKPWLFTGKEGDGRWPEPISIHFMGHWLVFARPWTFLFSDRPEVQRRQSAQTSNVKAPRVFRQGTTHHAFLLLEPAGQTLDLLKDHLHLSQQPYAATMEASLHGCHIHAKEYHENP